MIVTITNNDNIIDWGVTGNERIVQNVRNILRTRPFEVPFMREMGINSDYIDSNPQQFKADLANHITDVINKYEPRVNVLDVNVEECDENGNLIIAVELEV